MTVAPRLLTLAGTAVLTATLAIAQSQTPKQPPLPQDPLPAPPHKPMLEKEHPDPPTPAPGLRLGGSSELVLAGCLQLAPTGRPDSPSAGAESSPIAASYLLREALPVSKDGTRETTGSHGKDYRVVAGSNDVKLAEFVGHQVKITGRVDVRSQTPGRTATESGRSTSQPSGSTGVSSTPAPAPTSPPVTLTVSSVESLAATCTTPAS
jgi:hypothetical protein